MPSKHHTSSRAPSSFVDPGRTQSRDARRSRTTSFSRSRDSRCSVQQPVDEAPKESRTSISLHRKSWGHLRKRSSAANAIASQPPEPQGPSYYYQDPETRRQLKLCLASQQHFEEALQYGFPTSPTLEEPYTTSGIPRDLVGRHRKSSSRVLPGRASNDAQRFMRQESLSFIDHPSSPELSDSNSITSSRQQGGTKPRHEDEDEDIDDDDDSSFPDLDSPVTPGFNGQQSWSSHPHIVTQNSFGSDLTRENDHPMSALPPFPKRTTSSNWQQGNWPGQREMTIRMTLTKPELRDHDQPAHYVGHASKSAAPRVLPERDAHDPDPCDRNRVSRMLRRMTIGRKD